MRWIVLILLLQASSVYAARNFDKHCIESVLQGDTQKYKNSEYLSEQNALVVYEKVAGDGSKASDFVQYVYTDIGSIYTDYSEDNFWCIDVVNQAPQRSLSSALNDIFNDIYSRKKATSAPDQLNYLKGVGFACRKSRFTKIHDSLLNVIPDVLPDDVVRAIKRLE